MFTGVAQKWRHAPRGEGVHIIVTMCDAGEGWKYCDVTTAARPGQGVIDNSTSIWDSMVQLTPQATKNDTIAIGMLPRPRSCSPWSWVVTIF